MVIKAIVLYTYTSYRFRLYLCLLSKRIMFIHLQNAIADPVQWVVYKTIGKYSLQ